MAEVMRHPFFQRRQDTDSGRRINLVEPPRLEEIARPVRSEREIDRDILRNLRTLWNGASDKEIVQSLLSHEYVEPNWSNKTSANATGKHGRRRSTFCSFSTEISTWKISTRSLSNTESLQVSCN